jgi:hypothetical protein
MPRLTKEQKAEKAEKMIAGKLMSKIAAQKLKDEAAAKAAADTAQEKSNENVEDFSNAETYARKIKEVKLIPAVVTGLTGLKRLKDSSAAGVKAMMDVVKACIEIRQTFKADDMFARARASVGFTDALVGKWYSDVAAVYQNMKLHPAEREMILTRVVLDGDGSPMVDGKGEAIVEKYKENRFFVRDKVSEMVDGLILSGRNDFNGLIKEYKKFARDHSARYYQEAGWIGARGDGAKKIKDAPAPVTSGPVKAGATLAQIQAHINEEIKDGKDGFDADNLGPFVGNFLRLFVGLSESTERLNKLYSDLGQWISEKELDEEIESEKTGTND